MKTTLIILLWLLIGYGIALIKNMIWKKKFIEEGLGKKCHVYQLYNFEGWTAWDKFLIFAIWPKQYIDFTDSNGTKKGHEIKFQCVPILPADIYSLKKKENLMRASVGNYKNIQTGVDWNKNSETYGWAITKKFNISSIFFDAMAANTVLGPISGFGIPNIVGISIFIGSLYFII